MTYKEILTQTKKGKFLGIYLLHGDEDYFIDLVETALTDAALKAEERDFNMEVFYGAETKAGMVINSCRQFPMMAERRVVVVREFQSMKDKVQLASYVAKPVPTTVLILCHKHGAMESKTLVTKVQKAGGAVMESKRLFDNQIPAFASDYLSQKGLEIDMGAAVMLTQHVGSDLTRMAGEMEKLRLALPEGQNTIHSSLVEQVTGVSKEYNNFELQNAIAQRNVLLSNKIINYFASNPKGFVMTLTLSGLFSLFQDVLIAHYSPNKTEAGVAQWMGKNPWAVKRSIFPAMKNYSAGKVVNILSQIRQTDAKLKGVEGCRTDAGELLRELVCYILT